MPEITTLDNGLRIITHQMKETEAISINIWVSVGSRYEKISENGLSHFLEHMAFKGTKRRSARQIAEEFDNIGGYFNAGTGREHTTYYAKVLKEDFTIAMDILSDILLNSVFDAEELERERGVILQEIAMTNDTPDDLVFDCYQETAFSEQAMGRSILGTESNIKKFTRDDLINYMNNHYTAQRIVVSVAGNISNQQVIDITKSYFNNVKKASDVKHEDGKYTGGTKLITRDLEQTHIVLGFSGPSYNSKDIYTAQILSNILGGGMSSRLFQEVREKRGLAYSISSFSSNYSDVGLFSVYSGTAPENISELISVVNDEFNKVAENITDEELKRAKAQSKAGILMAKESSSNMADDMGRYLICFDRFIPYQEMIDKIEVVDAKSVSRLMKEITSSSKRTIAAIGDVSAIKQN
ncbi:insulinase family protein [Rickettsiales bacterium]|nr:insulinase family protein [Rickettsiales bacterium]